jgi:hypothetical protein
MKKTLLFGALALLASPLFAADAGPKDDVIGAAKKLAEKGNYSWKTSIENAGGGGGGRGGRGGGPTEGKTEKDGFTVLSMTRGENTIQSVLKGGKGAIKTQDGWKSLTEAVDDQDRQNPARFTARMLQNFKAPSAQAEELVGKTKELKKDGDVYSGDLTQEGAKALLTLGGGRGGGGNSTVSNAKGSAKFWIKDGVLSKYQYNVKGTVSFNGNDREQDRTTTVEIKDIGSTKVEVPEDAKKKLS